MVTTNNQSADSTNNVTPSADSVSKPKSAVCTNSAHRLSALLLCPSPSQKSKNPFSAFYNHPITRTSLDQVRSQSANTSTTQLPPYEQDPEAGRVLPRSTSPQLSRQHSFDGDVRGKIGLHYGLHETQSSVWPSKRELEEKALVVEQEERRKRLGLSFCMGQLTLRQRLLLKLLIALFVIGVAVALGVGISRAVGGGVYKGNGTQVSIPKDGG